MAADVTVKQGDTWPPLRARLEQANEETGASEPIPGLGGATSITFVMKEKTGGTVLVEGACTVLSEPNAEVQYTWHPTDTESPGEYQVEFSIVWGAGKEQTVPNSGYRVIVVEAELGA